MAGTWGCAGGPRTGDPLPPDFTCEVTIAPGGRLHAGWYIVEADGVLRAALGTRGRRSPAPLPVRALTDEELEEVWRLAQVLVEPGEPNRPGTVEVFVGAEGRGSRRNVPEAEAASLAALLSRLAWGN
jgi:hypothetical protein